MPSRDSQYRLTPSARVDLEEVWDYTVATWSLPQAERYHEQIIAAFEALAAAPDRGLDVGDLRAGYLRWTVGMHFIFYRKADYGIKIVRILHQQRDIPRHL